MLPYKKKSSSPLPEGKKTASHSHSTGTTTQTHETKSSANSSGLDNLLQLCGQSSKSTFLEVMSMYSNRSSISKHGEGRYGEVFTDGQNVFKSVAVQNGLLVKDYEKQLEALFAEAKISQTLNTLRTESEHNFCSTFIKTSRICVCSGPYTDDLKRAKEKWDIEHNSRNSMSLGGQSFVVFAQENGGQDLKSFKLLSFKEAQSVLAQVTIALAVAEAAFEFEHRDLHWENIVLNRNSSETMSFVLDGEKKDVKTYGVVASIIDFTFSRIKIPPSSNGKDVVSL
ncbi:hypothetical protein L2E82_22833 [Cichorium intybus]|uniref:Uncharacterized protein n=1 Tax=Cichorium intybus TaxID=13427 RepID=A0ACB9DYU8_CICIN|nr:hypothetical protein L2E82_22833 [Cichorium intybus]